MVKINSTTVMFVVSDGQAKMYGEWPGPTEELACYVCGVKSGIQDAPHLWFCSSECDAAWWKYWGVNQDEEYPDLSKETE